MLRRHHPVQRQLERTRRVAEEVGDAAQRLVLACVQHMQDGADQQRVTGLFPMVPAFECAIGIDKNVGHVLHVAHFVRAAPHFQQRVVGCRLRIRGVEQEAVAKPRTPACGERPVLAFDVVNDDGCGPTQQGGNDQAHTLARARWCEGQDVFRAFMAEVLAAMQPEENPVGLDQPSFAYVFRIGPACRTVGGDKARLPRAPHRHGDGDHHGHQTTSTRDGPADIEDVRRVGIKEEPPLEQPPRVIDRGSKEVEPWRAKA